MPATLARPPLRRMIRPANPFAQGLIGCWTFREGAGTAVGDVSRNIHLGGGSVSGSNWSWGDGPWNANGPGAGGSLVLGGTDAFVTVPIAGSALLVPQAFTVEAWARVNTVGAGSFGVLLARAGADYRIMAGATSGHWHADVTGRLSAGAKDTGLAWTPGAWQHVVLRSVPGETAFFANGVKAIFDTGSGTVTYTTNGTLQFGARSGGLFLNGSIGLARMWERPLDDAEVEALYADPWLMWARRSATIDYASLVSGGTSYSSSLALAATSGLATSGAVALAGSVALAATSGLAVASVTALGGSVALAAASAFAAGSAWSGSAPVALAATSGLAIGSVAAMGSSVALAATSALVAGSAWSGTASLGLAATSDFIAGLGSTYLASLALAATSGLAVGAAAGLAGSLGLAATSGLSAGSAADLGGPVALAAVAALAPRSAWSGSVSLPLLCHPALGVSVPAGAAGLANRDWDIVLDIQARLDATGAFADVRLCVAPENRTPVAVVDQAEFDEDRLGIEDELIRTVRPVVSLLSRSFLPEDRMAELSRLSSVVQDAVDGQSLAGLTVPGMTRTHKGTFATKGQETTLTMKMEAAYIVPGPAGHDAAER